MAARDPAYESKVEAAVWKRLQLATSADPPFTEGVHYESISVDGSYPDGSLKIRFRQDEHPGVPFGLTFPLALACGPDDFDRSHGQLDPDSPEDVAELVTIRLDQQLERHFFELPDDAHSDDAGVVWIQAED